MMPGFMESLPAILPELVLALGAILLLALGVSRQMEARFCVRFVLIASVVALGAMAYSAGPIEGSFAGIMAFDGLASAGRLLVLASLIAALLLSHPWLESAGMQNAEYVSLLLLSGAGLMGVCASANWIALLVFLEISSISLAAIMGMRRGVPASREAAIKFFILSAFASAFIVFGAAVLFSRVRGFSMMAPEYPDSAVVTGTLFILAGLSFKCSLVPFHAWAPDTYEGGPTPVVAFIASASKVAGFTAMARFLLSGGAGSFIGGGAVLWVLAAMSMLGGTILALTQTNLKRLMAYSGISQSGYLLLAFLGAAESRTESVVTYLVVYTAMTLGMLAVISALEDEGKAPEVSSLPGLGARHPLLAAALGVFLFSLTGLPPTAGFFAKFQVFREALSTGYLYLVLVAVVSSVISAGIYIRLLVPAVMEGEGVGWREFSLAPGVAAITLLASIILVIGGLFPSLLVSLSRLFLAQ